MWFSTQNLPFFTEYKRCAAVQYEGMPLFCRLTWRWLSVLLLFFVGGFFSTIFSSLFGTREMRILILGLDGAGKTTILYRLQVGEVVTTIPSKQSVCY